MPIIMGIVVVAISGVAFGYSLQVGALVVLSVLLVGIAVAWLVQAQEIEKLFPAMFCVYGSIFLLSMWVTWYVANDQNWMQVFFHEYIFR